MHPCDTRSGPTRYRAWRVIAVLSAAVPMAASPPASAAVQPREFAVASVTLGMTTDEVEGRLRAETPPLQIRLVDFRVNGGPATYTGAIVGEHASRPNLDDDAVIVLLTRTEGRAFEVLREREYNGAITATALEDAVTSQYGLALRPAISGIPGILSVRADFDSHGQPTNDVRCTSAGAGPTADLANRMLTGTLLGSLKLVSQFTPDCGIMFDLLATSPAGQPGVILSVQQRLYDQNALARDAAASKAADAAAVAKVNEDAARAAAGNKPHL